MENSSRHAVAVVAVAVAVALGGFSSKKGHFLKNVSPAVWRMADGVGTWRGGDVAWWGRGVVGTWRGGDVAWHVCFILGMYVSF